MLPAGRAHSSVVGEGMLSVCATLGAVPDITPTVRQRDGWGKDYSAAKPTHSGTYVVGDNRQLLPAVF